MPPSSSRKLIAVIVLAIVDSTFSIAHGAPTALTKIQDLSFGKFTTGTGAGTVTVDNSGARSSSGGVVLLKGGAVTAAQFTITGNSGRSYTLSVPTTLTLASGTYQVTVSGMTPSIAATGVIPSTGSISFTVGGTMNVSTSQHYGTYSGTLTVSVK